MRDLSCDVISHSAWSGEMGKIIINNKIVTPENEKKERINEVFFMNSRVRHKKGHAQNI